MRKKFIAGNWKMYKTPSEAAALATELKNFISDDKVQVAVCPPSIAIPAVVEVLRGSHIKVGAQNCHFEKQGAFTGEISPEMILDTGCEFVIIGHSERRQYFSETDELINKKIKSVLDSGLNVIFCCGETLEQRETNQTQTVIEKQIRGGLEGIDDLTKITLAYEPVWAIGTGKTASPLQAVEVHQFIRNLIQKMYCRSTAETVCIQYGGSVKPENAAELLSNPDIDGALVGGASLKAELFAAIVRAC